ncbi:MAG: hypothetical protein HQL58_12645 [Magnetococcales bacterium]|nr:hypothetical protein [Magnetococcales bacterium]
MSSSYEAIYDHGQIRWVGDAPGPVRARAIVTLIGEAVSNDLPGPSQSVDEIEQVLQKAWGAWGTRSLEETEAVIRQKRIEDWDADTFLARCAGTIPDFPDIEDP